RELPVELVPVDTDDERSALRLRGRHVADPRQLVEHEPDDDRKDDDGHRRPEELSFVAPWICGPSCVRGRFRRRDLTTNQTNAPSTRTKMKPVRSAMSL